MDYYEIIWRILPEFGVWAMLCIGGGLIVCVGIASWFAEKPRITPEGDFIQTAQRSTVMVMYQKMRMAYLHDRPAIIARQASRLTAAGFPVPHSLDQTDNYIERLTRGHFDR